MTTDNKKEEKSPLRTIFRGSGWYGLSVAVGRAFPALMTVILAWCLDPRELGVISFVLAYYTVLLGVADWSITYSLQKLIPEDRERVGQIAWTALCVRFGSSAILGLLCWALDALRGTFHGYGLHLGLLLVASSFGTIAYVYNARCRFAAGSLLSIAFQAGWVAIALVLIKLGMRITGPLFGLCISFAGVGISALLFSSVVRGQMAFLPKVAKEILHFGLLATLATLLATFADQVGILAVAYVNGDEAAGVFKVATTFGMLPGLLGMVVALPLMPVAKNSLLNGDNISVTLVRPIIRYLLLVGLPIAAVGFALAPAVIGTFVRQTYLGAIWPMRILLVANVLRTLVTALSGILFVGEGLKQLAMIQCSVAAVAVAGSVLLARNGGLTGVAMALLAAWAFGLIHLYLWFERRTPLQLEWVGYLRYAGSAAVAATGTFLAGRLFGAGVVQLVTGGCVAGIVYVFLLWIQRDVAFQNLTRLLRAGVVG
jgi:O-antigen/teichoic acid export membrane protein